MFLTTTRHAVGVFICAAGVIAPGLWSAIEVSKPAPFSVGLASGHRLAPPRVSCSACIVVDERERMLFGRAVDERRSNASTTKMVTALVVESASDLSEEVSVSARAAATDGGGLDLEPGDGYSVEELLYALLMTSSNDAAVALAEHVAGTEEEFVARMNRFLESIGADNTHFLTSHGLDTSGHYSTAGDLAGIGRRLLSSPVLASIVATRTRVIQSSDGSETLVNRNLLLESYRGAIGIKTGFTTQAGNVLVAAARRSGKTLIAVAMGSVDATVDARALLNYGWDRLRRTVLLRPGSEVGGLVWPFGAATGLIASDPVRGMADRSALRVTVRAVEPVDADDGLEAGDPIGRIVLSTASRRIGTITALASDTVTLDETPWPADVASSLMRVGARLIGRI